jgi:putative membrane protein
VPEPSVQTARVERAEIRETTGKLSDSADRRTELAADRTQLAAERTYAAWVRTGLAALASGIGAKALLTGILPGLGVMLAGSVLTLFSAFCFGAAVWREISPGVPPPRPDTRRIPRALLFVVNGFLAIVAGAALVSIWATRG